MVAHTNAEMVENDICITAIEEELRANDEYLEHLSEDAMKMFRLRFARMGLLKALFHLHLILMKWLRMIR